MRTISAKKRTPALLIPAYPNVTLSFTRFFTLSPPASWATTSPSFSVMSTFRSSSIPTRSPVTSDEIRACREDAGRNNEISRFDPLDAHASRKTGFCPQIQHPPALLLQFGLIPVDTGECHSLLAYPVVSDQSPWTPSVVWSCTPRRSNGWPMFWLQYYR